LPGWCWSENVEVGAKIKRLVLLVSSIFSEVFRDDILSFSISIHSSSTLVPQKQHFSAAFFRLISKFADFYLSMQITSKWLGILP